jgi:hypothetical protein
MFLKLINSQINTSQKILLQMYNLNDSTPSIITAQENEFFNFDKKAFLSETIFDS